MHFSAREYRHFGVFYIISYSYAGKFWAVRGGSKKSAVALASAVIGDRRFLLENGSSVFSGTKRDGDMPDHAF